MYKITISSLRQPYIHDASETPSRKFCIAVNTNHYARQKPTPGPQYCEAEQGHGGA